MIPPPPRYAPHRSFPPYAYLPGRNPHPTRDPRGHSPPPREPTAPPAPSQPLDPRDWRRSEAYLWGVDLYNHGFLWEAHEAWEELWHPAKGTPLVADHLQGLIQCAAAALKVAMDQPRGLVRLADQGLQRLERVAGEAGPRFMGLDLGAFVAAFRSFAASGPTSIDGRPRIELEPDPGAGQSDR